MFGRRFIEPFEEALMKAFGTLEASPLRIVTPRIDSQRNGFVVNTGLLSPAAPISEYFFCLNSISR